MRPLDSGHVKPMSNDIDLDKVTLNILATVAQSELGL
jgi:hypothetical protein